MCFEHVLLIMRSNMRIRDGEWANINGKTACDVLMFP